ncbi:alanine--tRNA ligase-related protein [Actinoplanes sp. CA-252034]|uniref:alanine--tRNA ligase-related protein n=1 Tax=Actinoplanes sp. CA-252034 TaxID=3239906 RepID=UPI003D961828
MSTTLIYLDEPDLNQADATVMRADAGPAGDLTIVLDQTIFYPQGGGQPTDRGRIETAGGTAEIVRVSFADGEVLHHGYHSRGRVAVGERAGLHIDPGLRREHSRLHTGGHLVMTAVDRLIGLPATKGYHFPDGPYVEFAGVVPPERRESVAEQIQAELDRLVAENSEVTWRFDSVEKLRAAGVHIPAEIPDGKPTRVVITAGYHSPCGGTHVPRLGELKGLRAKSVRFKSGRTRVSYDLG